MRALQAAAGSGSLACDALEGLDSFSENLDFHTAGIVFYIMALILTGDLEYKPKMASYLSKRDVFVCQVDRSEWAPDS